MSGLRRISAAVSLFLFGILHFRWNLEYSVEDHAATATPHGQAVFVWGHWLRGTTWCEEFQIRCLRCVHFYQICGAFGSQRPTRRRSCQRFTSLFMHSYIFPPLPMEQLTIRASAAWLCDMMVGV
ncbi:hypothetical protein BGZ63DRAFT_377961 [Mariannaea sp. PMI_226]|nr:hypothetical protein BGZ63DRAFT_377961 [Mariannaea sp. PMI_226]